MTDSLPVIDVSGLRAGTPEPGIVEAVAAEIRAACTGPGFFYIRGHGIPQPVIDAAVTAAQDFFHLPAETKRQVAANALHRGWHAMGGALMEGARLADRKEFFSIGLELPADDETVLAGEKLRGPNQWPAFAPAVQPAEESEAAVSGAGSSPALLSEGEPAPVTTAVPEPAPEPDPAASPAPVRRPRKR